MHRADRCAHQESESSQRRKEQQPRSQPPGEQAGSSQNQCRGPVHCPIKSPAFAAAPDAQHRHREQSLRQGRHRPGQGQRSQSPEQEAIRVVFLNVVNLRHQPNAGPKEHASQQANCFAQLPPAIAVQEETQSARMQACDPGEYNAQLGELVEAVPIVGMSKTMPKPPMTAPRPENTMVLQGKGAPGSG